MSEDDVDSNTIAILAETKAETHILARTMVGQGADPLAVFSAMYAGVTEFSVEAFQYDEERILSFMEKALDHCRTKFSSKEYMIEKGRFIHEKEKRTKP